MKRLLLILLAVAGLLVGVMAFRAATLESRQPGPAEPVRVDLDIDAIAQRFARALTFATISNDDRSDIDIGAFLRFHAYLEESYPALHEALQRETVSELSLLYTWEGSEPDLDPVVLMGHLDVVPVIPGTESDWTQPPFAGVIDGGEIWGRGAIDDKSSVMAIFEAVEHLVTAGFRPRRTVYLAFGHDEEVGGPDGAGVIADLLEGRGAEPYAFVLDEGGAITDGLIPGLEGPVAIIGIAEKGFVNLELKVEGGGGHSSTPPEHTNIGILAAAIAKLENDPFPARLDGATVSMFEVLGPEMPFLSRMVLANLWLTRPLVTRLLLSDRTSASMVRTTTAVTMIDGGVKSNVLPINAIAVVNHRILPGETRQSVATRVRQVIDDERVQVREVTSNADPSPVSDPESAAFALLGKTLRQVAPDEGILVAPYLVMGGTDAKYYSGRSPNVYRFLPVMIGQDGLQLAHGTNERISTDSLGLAVRYMIQLLRNTDELD